MARGATRPLYGMSATRRLRTALRRPAMLAWLVAIACRGEATPPVVIGYADPFQRGSERPP